jgi:uncharacterized protein (TIGR02271 family)
MQGQQFVEGATVYDTTGAKVGRLRAYNPQGGYLLVEKGWLFSKDLYIPLAAVQGTDAAGDVHLLGLRKDDLQDDHYATPPVGGTTAVGSDGQSTTTQADEETITVPVHEGDVVVGTQEEEQGRVRLHKEVVQEHETVSVSLEQERITIECVPVTEQGDPIAAPDAFQERDIEVPAMGEEAVVGKQTRATKAVRVRKERVIVEADPDAVQADDAGTPRPRHRKQNRKRH